MNINQSKEIWQDIEGYKGLYQISNLGNISGLKPVLTKDGYYNVSLCKDGKRKSFRIHRLVCNAFIPNTENKRTINHKDGNKLNNNVDNLEWMTHKENNNHAWKTGLITKKFGEDVSNNKLLYKEVLQIKNLIKVNTGKELAEKFKVSEGTISLIKNNKIWNNYESE